MPFATQTIHTESATLAGFFLSDEAGRQNLETLLRPCNITPVISKHTKGKAAFLRELAPSELASLQLVVLDLKDQKDPLELAREVTARCNPQTVVVALGVRNDIALFRQLRDAGVGDYLVHPVPGHVLMRAVESLLGKKNSEAGACTVAFYSTHGGSGAGLLAAGVSSHLAGIHGRESFCADSDFASPSLGNHLGVDKPGDLSMLLEAGERLDATLVKQGARVMQDNLSLFNSFDPMREALPNEGETAKRLLGFLREQCRFLIWRVAGSGALQRQVMLSADIIYVAATGTLPSAAAAQAMLDWISRNNSRAVTAQICNTVAPRQPLTPEMLSQVTGRKNALVIPWKKKLGRDLAVNLSLRDKAHSMYKEFAFLSGEIAGVRVDKGNGLLQRLGL